MTTILGLRTNTTAYLASDTQVTEGNRKMPLEFNKIFPITDKIVVASCGSVGEIQQIIEIVLKEVYHNKINSQRLMISPLNLEMSQEEFVGGLAEINFTYPLQFKQFSSSSYLVMGNTSEKATFYAVDASGSQIEIPYYYADGSGGDYALSLLADGYKEDMTDEQAEDLIYRALRSSHKIDIYTGKMIQLYKIKDGVMEQAFISQTSEEEPKEEVKEE